MKHICKRALVLALVLLFVLAPVMTLRANAATSGSLTDANIGLSFSKGGLTDDSDYSWVASGTSITGTVSGNTLSNSTTLTITNNLANNAVLSFEYKVEITDNSSGILNSKGAAKVNGTSCSNGATGSVNVKLAKGGTVTVSIESGSRNSGKTTVWITNIVLTPPDGADITFKTATNGSYTVDGTAITTETTTFYKGGTQVNMVAIPAAGYQFLAWYDANGNQVSVNENYVLAVSDEPVVIYPKFVPASDAIFSVNNIRYAGLNAAIEAAVNGSTKTIVVAKNGTVPAGDYTIPAGITLLVPFNDANTLYTKDPGHTGTTYTIPTKYRELTLATGANITVNGAISVSAKHCAGGSATSGQSHCGSPSGACGFMHMESGSTITINNGGALYAWGFVTGSGEITAKSGASVYENMQVEDFRGGSCTMSMTGGGFGAEAVNCYGTFPFSQYYVQNIEAKLILECGANEYATTSLTISSMSESSSVPFIGSGALFTIESGSVSKWYDGATDRLHLEVNGSVKMNPMDLTVDAIIAKISINSAEYVLPITNNITIHVNSGSIINMNQDLALLPGTEVYVEAGAKMTVPEGYSMYIYDADEWSNYYLTDENDVTTKYTNGVFVYPTDTEKWNPVSYAPGRAYTRTAADVIKDAKVVLNGELYVNGTWNEMDMLATGIYTTEGGADITGKGKITMVVPTGYDPYFPQWTTQVLQGGAEGTTPIPVDILINPMRLKNDDGSYTDTYDSVAGDTYQWSECTKKWTKNLTEPVHTVVVDEAVAPDCTNTGLTEGSHCSACGKVLVAQKTIAALGHTEAEAVEENRVDATCTEAGSYDLVVYCTVCTEEVSRETITVDALGHTEAEAVEENRVNATCTEAGSYDLVVHCSVCTEEVSRETVIIDALGHTEEAIPGKDATCTETGLTEGIKCSVCGETIKAQEEIPALGHTASEAVEENRVDATCTEAGSYEKVICCSVCGAEMSRETITIDALGHDWNDGEVTTAAGCESAGVKTYTCGNCGETKTEAIDATGHTEVEDAAVEATCTTEGKTAGSHCSKCNANLSGNDVIPALGHTASEAVEENRVNAACGKAGSYDLVVYCSVCDAELSRKTETIDALEHQYNAVVTAPTCTEKGYTTHTCSACGDSYVTDEVAALGHTASEAVKENEIAPSCTTAGSYDLIVYCAVCNDVMNRETITVDALGHTEAEAVKENCVAATCTKEGSCDLVIYCSVCETELSRKAEVIPATGHTEETIPGKDATCTETGLTEGKKCSVCGETTKAQEEIPALGHSGAEAVEENRVEATCTEAGSYDKVTYCSVCKKELNREKMAIPTISHSYENGSCIHCGEADPNAVEKFDLAGTFMVLGNSLQINFAVDTAKLEGTDNYAVVTKEYADREAVTVTIPQSEWLKYSGSLYYFSFNGVAAKEMTDDLTVIVYNADGVQMTNTKVDSIEDYCVRMLRKSTKAEERTVFVDMLNYGAAAQKYFGYKEDDLANAQLTEQEQQYATQSVTMEDSRVKGEGYAGTLPVLECEIILNFVYSNSVIGNAAYAEASYTDHYGKAKSVIYQADEFVSYGSTMKRVPVSGMAVADFGQPVTVKLYDAEGNVLSTSVDSLESYIARMAEGGDEIFDAVMKFATGAYNYFH